METAQNGATAIADDTPDNGRVKPWLFAVVIVLGGAAFIVGCSEGEGLSEEDFVGTWITHDGVYIQFNENGTLTAAWSVDDLAEGTVNRGRWSLDGSEFTYIGDEDGPGCHGPGYYTVEPAENGAVTWTLIGEDTCPLRTTDFHAGPMRPYTP